MIEGVPAPRAPPEYVETPDWGTPVRAIAKVAVVMINDATTMNNRRRLWSLQSQRPLTLKRVIKPLSGVVDYGSDKQKVQPVSPLAKCFGGVPSA